MAPKQDEDAEESLRASRSMWPCVTPLSVHGGKCEVPRWQRVGC